MSSRHSSNIIQDLVSIVLLIHAKLLKHGTKGFSFRLKPNTIGSGKVEINIVLSAKALKLSTFLLAGMGNIKGPITTTRMRFLTPIMFAAIPTHLS